MAIVPGKRTVLRFELNESREGIYGRGRGRSFRVEGNEDRRKDDCRLGGNGNEDVTGLTRLVHALLHDGRCALIWRQEVDGSRALRSLPHEELSVTLRVPPGRSPGRSLEHKHTHSCGINEEVQIGADTVRCTRNKVSYGNQTFGGIVKRNSDFFNLFF